MSWRTVIVTGMAKLDYKLDYLVIRKKESTSRVHLSEIGLLIIESTMVSITTTLILELNKNKIKVIFCDEKHSPSSELVSLYGSHDSSARIKEQMRWREDVKCEVATEIIREKINKQRELLLELGHFDEAELLGQYVADVLMNDVSNREGHAAKVYFNALFGKGFTRSKECAINSSLNFGYGIILSMFNREIVSSGYLTQLGLFHDNKFNHFNFSSDLMEPFRVIIDRRVHEIEPLKFERAEKLKILDVTYEQLQIDGKRRYLDAAIKYYCRSVFAALNACDIRKLSFYKYEL